MMKCIDCCSLNGCARTSELVTLFKRPRAHCQSYFNVHKLVLFEKDSLNDVG